MKFYENNWFARAFMIFSFVVYALVGRYFEVNSFPSHYDGWLAMIPAVNIVTPVTIGLIAIYAYAAWCLRPLIGTKEEARFFLIFGSFLLERSVMCLAAQFGPPAGYVVAPDTVLNKIGFLFHKDFFFSGHTSAPWLFFLFFKGKARKIFFTVGTIAMMAGVLLMHHHYVIDVLAAFSMVYGVYAFYTYVLFNKKEVN